MSLAEISVTLEIQTSTTLLKNLANMQATLVSWVLNSIRCAVLLLRGFLILA